MELYMGIAISVKCSCMIPLGLLLLVLFRNIPLSESFTAESGAIAIASQQMRGKGLLPLLVNHM